MKDKLRTQPHILRVSEGKYFTLSAEAPDELDSSVAKGGQYFWSVNFQASRHTRRKFSLKAKLEHEGVWTYNYILPEAMFNASIFKLYHAIVTVENHVAPSQEPEFGHKFTLYSKSAYLESLLPGDKKYGIWVFNDTVYQCSKNLKREISLVSKKKMNGIWKFYIRLAKHKTAFSTATYKIKPKLPERPSRFRF